MSAPDTSTIESFKADVAAFNACAQALGLGDVSRHYWYHTIDLGDGLITPGLYDYRATIDAFRFPCDLSGKRVLDVGSATGFFAFEFERRGAEVTSVELPSLEKLDRFPGQGTEQLLREIEHMIVPHSSERLGGYIQQYSAEDLWFYLLEGPFSFCARQLNANIRRVYSSVYELSRANVGPEPFDLVLLGDILVHTLRPFDALAAVVPLCRGTLIVAQLMPGSPADPPAMLYQGGTDPHKDDISWWLPNEQCFTQLFQKFGFARVESVGHYGGVLRPAGFRFDRTILHAHR